MAWRLYKKGFTLIEITLSLVFVTILALAIALIISNTIEAYQRGLILNRINTVGMSLVDNFRLAVQGSSGKTLKASCAIVYQDPIENNKCEQDEAYRFVSVTKYSAMSVKKGTGTVNYSEIPIYGAFCSGTYSYIWNTGYFESSDASFNGKNGGWAKFKYKNKSGGTEVIGGGNKPFRLLKIKDTTRAVCISATAKNQYATPAGGVPNEFDITGIGDGQLDEDPEFLISDNETEKLALYELLIVRPALATEDNSLFYAGSFILGTVGGGIDIKATGKTCAAPNDYGVENFDYCAINKFNFAVQANGE